MIEWRPLAHLFLGLILILMAFWACSQSNAVFALFGFLSFFVVGVTVIVEGFKNRKSEKI